MGRDGESRIKVSYASISRKLGSTNIMTAICRQMNGMTVVKQVNAQEASISVVRKLDHSIGSFTVCVIYTSSQHSTMQTYVYLIQVAREMAFPPEEVSHHLSHLSHQSYQ